MGKGKPLSKGCLYGALGLVLFMVVCVFAAPLYRSSDVVTPLRSRPPTNRAVLLHDGSKFPVENLRSANDWSCGKMKTGSMKLPDGQTAQLRIYLDRMGAVVSIRIPAIGNKAVYENPKFKGRECVINWETEDFEMLTDAEYKKLEKLYPPQ